ncbi:hypothetical protein G9A89_015788 [Geosiphon pyriformis]|nr:hypothetical protein G9A89_015788 [Geosiphon pyriformis]
MTEEIAYKQDFCRRVDFHSKVTTHFSELSDKQFLGKKTKASNKDKQKLKQHSNITPNTPKTLKTTTKHLQTPEQETSENKSNHSENLESEETELEQEKTTENKEKIKTAYITKIPEFTGENNNTSPQE